MDNEITRTAFESRIPPLCGRCGGRTDGKVSAPSMKGFGALISCECPAEAVTRTAAPLDSGAIDNALLCATNRWLQDRLDRATWQLQRALKLPKTSVRRDLHLRLAMDALKGIGEA
jgi:hypothetical protein